ncbi:hypothetical protein N8Z47_03030 [Salibacteraceae bacterium]|nr:hypothetical protein [Salibacteraceae bacterium]
MRNLIGILIILSAMLTSSLHAQECKNFHKKRCYGSDDPYMRYNTQSKSGMFILGHTSDLVFVGHAGQDYRISLCQDNDVEEPIKFQVIDSRSKDVLYDNESDALDVPVDEDSEEEAGLPMFFEFSCEVTKKIIIRITAPGPPPEEGKDKEKGRRNDEVDPESLFCVGVLLENMPTPKLGF